MSVVRMIHCANNGREASLAGLSWFMLYASLPCLLILAALRLWRGDYVTRAELESLQAAQRLDSSKLSDIGFAYQCPECQFITVTEWHAGDHRCPQCHKLRKFVGVTVLDEHVSRGLYR